MKFFTNAWWAGDEERDAAAEYRAYFETIRSALHESATAFDSSVNLHDAELIELNYIADERTLLVAFDYYADNDEMQSIGIRYDGVTAFYVLPPDDGVDDENEFGDLGYNEFDRAGELFEHRMLFASGREIRVVFGDMSWGTDTE